MSPQKMVELTVSVLIFTTLIGVIANELVNPNENITGGARALLLLTTLIIVAVFIVFITKQFSGKK